MKKIMISVIALLLASTSYASTLEIPGPNTRQSGIGAISGWKCDANGPLTAHFDNGRTVPFVYGSERTDTQSVCGDTDNGFVAIWN